MAFVLAPRADRDLEDIADYIAEDNPDRAVTFIDEILAHCALIDEQPAVYPRRGEFGAGIRMAMHGHYRILFRTGAEGVRIERVLHGAHRVPRPLRRSYAPATVKSSMRIVGESTPLRNSRSLAATRRWNMSLRLPATVISLTGKAIAPFSIQNPEAPRL